MGSSRRWIPVWMEALDALYPKFDVIRAAE